MWPRVFSRRVSRRAQDCANCGISFTWEGVTTEAGSFCCAGCAQGGPCRCTYLEDIDAEESADATRTNRQVLTLLVQPFGRPDDALLFGAALEHAHGVLAPALVATSGERAVFRVETNSIPDLLLNLRRLADFPLTITKIEGDRIELELTGQRSDQDLAPVPATEEAWPSANENETAQVAQAARPQPEEKTPFVDERLPESDEPGWFRPFERESAAFEFDAAKRAEEAPAARESLFGGFDPGPEQRWGEEPAAPSASAGEPEREDRPGPPEPVAPQAAVSDNPHAPPPAVPDERALSAINGIAHEIAEVRGVLEGILLGVRRMTTLLEEATEVNASLVPAPAPSAPPVVSPAAPPRPEAPAQWPAASDPETSPGSARSSGEPASVGAGFSPAGPTASKLTVIAYQFNDFQSLNTFQRSVRELAGVAEAKVSRFFKGTLHLQVEYHGDVPFADRLRSLGVPHRVVEAGDEWIEIELQDDAPAA